MHALIQRAEQGGSFGVDVSLGVVIESTKRVYVWVSY